MVFFIPAAVALVAAAGVQAQSSSQNCSYSLTVSSQADLDAISGCSTFTGDINISGSPATLIINGVRSLSGSINANNISTLTSLSAPQLANISSGLTLSTLVGLNTLSFPVLTKLESIHLQALPELETLQFNTGVQECSSVIISNTHLSSLSGLNLSAVQTFDVNNNQYIDDITVGITSISNALDISFNSQTVKVNMPNLLWANNATFQFCGSIKMPLLQKVNTSMGFINNTMSTLEFTNLTSMGESLAFVSNANLTNISMTNLKTIGGGFQVANNSELDHIEGFDSLTKVSGAVNFVGVFSEASLPKLEEVDGDLTIESSNELNCTYFDKLNSARGVRGDNYVCKGKQAAVSTAISAGATGSSAKTASAGTSRSGSSSSSSSNAGLQVAQGVGAIGGLFVAAVHLL